MLLAITAVVMPLAATVALAQPFTGTEEQDTINGTARADTIDSLGGDDTVNGLGGRDIIDGGSGADARVSRDHAD